MLLPLLLMVNSIVPTGTEYDAICAVGYYEGLTQGHEWHCAGTLVGPSTVLTARHCLEEAGAFAVRFRRNLDGSIGSVESDPSSFHNVAVQSAYLPAEGYVALLILAEPVTHIEPVPMLLSEVAELPVTVGGWGREGPGIGDGPKRELRVCESEISGVGSYHLYFPSAWASGGPGCGPNSNDSGAPLVLESARGGPHVVGVALGSSTAGPLWQYGSDPMFVSPQKVRQ